MPAAETTLTKRAPSRRRRATYAALDLGTHNCRLLIARPEGDAFRVVDSFARIVCLGEGMAESGRLSEAAMARAIGALKPCAAKMRRSGVTRSRVVATEACRLASNQAEFIARAQAESGLAVEVISHDQEARLTVAGCEPLLDAAMRRALVFDIGGGSTELMWLGLEGSGAPRLVAWTSLPCGVVALAERHGSGRISPSVFEGMVGEVARILAPFEAQQGLRHEIAKGGVQMLGTSGTVTTLAAVHLGLKRYDRRTVDGGTISFDEVNRVSARLAGMSRAERAAISTVGAARADLVVAGCAILAAIMRAWPVGTMRVADRGIREGLLLAMIASDERAGRGAAVA